MKKKNILHIIIIFITLPTWAQKDIDKVKIKASDLTKINNIQNIWVSPDQKKMVYTVKSIHKQDNSLEFDYRTHLWLYDGKEPRQVTFGKQSIGAVSWNNDGTKIAYLKLVESKAQVHILSLAGGEAEQVTNLNYSIRDVKWHPKANKLLLTAAVPFNKLLEDSLLNPKRELPEWSIEKPGYTSNKSLLKNTAKPNPDGTIDEIRAYLNKNEQDGKTKIINRLDFQGEATTEPELEFSQLFVFDLDTKKSDVLLWGYKNYSRATWSIDGESVLYSANLSASKHPDRERDSGIFKYNINSKTIQLIVGKAGMDYDFSSDQQSNNRLIITYSQSESVGFGKLAFINTDGTGLSTIDFDRSINQSAWSVDGQSIVFTANSNGGIPVYRYDLLSKKISQLTDFENGITAFGLMGSQIVYAKTNIENPSELFVSELKNMSVQKKISDHNGWVKERLLSRPSKGYLTNSLNQRVEYWVMAPIKVEAGKKYPLLLNMHGGPTAMWGPGEASMWHEFQYMAAQGYGIVYANPRGSGGYGLDFQRSNIKDWGTGPASDVLQACTLASRESWVDTNRLVLTGGSYAGYLTAWIVGHDHRFKAAFAQRGVYDLTTFMGEGNAWRLTPNYFGWPWDKDSKAILDRESPYTYVKEIKTPLMIKHGENDLRTGVIQSETLYKSMKILGKEVEYMRVPGATHELSRSGNVRSRIDRLLRIYEFFERYVAEK